MANRTFLSARGSEQLVVRIIGRNPSGETTSEEDCHVYKRRWVILLLYGLTAVADGMHWTQYTIITQTIIHYYKVPVHVVNLTAVSYCIIFIIFVAPAILLIEKFGLRNMLIFCDLLIIAASGLKLASLEPKYFYVGFAGQILVATATVFIVIVPSYLAGIWFPPNEVSTACALGVLGAQIGMTCGFFIPPQLVSVGEKHSTDGHKDTRSGLLYVYIYQSVLPVVILPLLIFIFKTHPPKPPSYARLTNHIEIKGGWSGAKELFSNFNYALILTGNALVASVFYCLSTFLNQVILDEQFAGFIGATIIVSGMIGCFFLGWILDKTHKFKIIAVIMCLASIVGLALFWVAIVLEWHSSVIVMSAVVIGMFLSTFVLISIEFSSEVTYPVSETISTSALLVSGEALSIILVYGSAVLVDKYRITPLIYTTSTFMVTSLLPICLIQSVRLKRLEASCPENQTDAENGIRQNNDETLFQPHQEKGRGGEDHQISSNIPFYRQIKQLWK